LFSIDQATGALSFKAAPDFEHPLDADGNNVYDVTVRADDGHGGIDTQAIAVTVTDQVLAAANDYIFTTESGLFAVNDSWLLANDEPHSALQIDYVHAGANGGYFDPFVSIIPTPWEALGDVYLDLDTSSGGQDNTYLKNGEHTTFGYTATDGTGSAVAATVEVTYVNSNSIDRSGDTHDDIIVGSSGNEQLTGGSGNDFIDGAGGDDRISGGTGTDSLYGADGDDRISGGAGMDSLYGGRGDDRIFGGAGMDSLYGGDGDDVIRYSKGDNAHGGLDSVASLGFSYDPPGTIFDFDVGLLAAGQRGDVLAFGESVNLTAAKYSGQFDGFETISLKEPDSNVAGSQTLTIGAGNVQAISDHQITLAGVFDGHAAVKIDMDQVDRLYLSISKDGGSWADTGSQTSDGYQIFAHTATGGGEDAYVLVSTPEMSHIVVNKDAPTP
jgi:Ca2+-binding RTX toxin-like protein